MKLSFFRLAIASCALMSTAALAHSPGYPDASGFDGGNSSAAPKLVLSAGYSVGGDDLASVEYEDYGDDDLEAGGGVYLGVGFEFPMASDMALRTAVGYQFDSIEADNGDATFDRLPWDLMFLLGSEPHRLGVGLTYHTDVSYELNIDGGQDVDADFDDALGLVLAYEFQISPAFGLMLRYTDIEYEENPRIPGLQGRTVDGSNFGIVANLIF